MSTDPAETPTTDAPPTEAPAPPVRRRRRRPLGRWSNPASPLQAARFARRESGKDVIQGIRKICPGHGHGPCRLDVSKLSDFESLRRRPSIEHIESFCRYYGKSPEALGLITWRDEPPPAPEAVAPTSPDPTPNHRDHDADPGRLVDAWLRESAVSIAAAVLQALARCPVSLTGQEHVGPPPFSQDDPADDPPAEEPAPADPPR